MMATQLRALSVEAPSGPLPLSGRCFYCNQPMLPPPLWGGVGPVPLNLETRDHVIPRALVRNMVGPFHPRWSRLNRVRACNGCNLAKRDMHPLDWLPHVPSRPGRDRLASRLHALGFGGCTSD